MRTRRARRRMDWSPRLGATWPSSSAWRPRKARMMRQTKTTKAKAKTKKKMKTRTLERTDAEVEDAKAGGEDGEEMERGKGRLTREPRPASQWPMRKTPMKRAERAIPLVI